MHPGPSPLQNPRLHYASSGQGGSLTYEDDRASILFHWEFGGGDCVAIFFVPAPAVWEQETGLPLTERDPILTFVARQSLQDQAPGCSYRLSDQFIELFRP